MNYFFVGLILASLSLNSNCNTYCNEIRNQKAAMQFVKLVQKRSYLVHRLEKPIKSLLRFHDFFKKKQFNVWNLFEHHHHDLNAHELVQKGFSDQFQHPVVKRCMRKLERKHDINAIYTLWMDFLSYKYIESDVFARETITAIALLYKEVMLQALSVHIKNDSNPLMLSHHKKNEATDTVVISNTEDLYDNFSSILNLLKESYDADFVINNNMRLYHIQRLFKSIIVLTKVMDKHAIDTFSYDLSSLPIEHEAIIFYVEKMKKAKSLEALLDLWHHVVSYKYINDQLFLKEFSSLLYIVHKQILTSFNGIATKDNPSLHDVIQLYEVISSMAIPDLLNSLDVVVDQCIELIEKYEIDSSMSWRAWGVKYWWIPPIILASVWINFYIKYKRLMLFWPN